jgi:sec-independent protein translocase protein TatC
MAAEDTLSPVDTSDVDDSEMDIWGHVGELRKRLIWAMAALIITTLANVFALATYFIDFLAQPVGGLDKLYAIEVTEQVGVYMRVSLLAGFIMALPVIVYEILAFIVPGLYDNEKRWVFSAIPIATLLFLAGASFAYFIMLPTALPFLLNFLNNNGQGVQAMTRISKYIEFVTSLMFWIGISFETPLVVFIMAKFHVVTPDFLMKQWRFAVIIIAILAAVITPTTDPISMGLLMGPLFVIYLLSILFAAIAIRTSKKEEDED